MAAHSRKRTRPQRGLRSRPGRRHARPTLAPIIAAMGGGSESTGHRSWAQRTQRVLAWDAPVNLIGDALRQRDARHMVAERRPRGDLGIPALEILERRS